jgi:hypothetical protein
MTYPISTSASAVKIIDIRNKRSHDSHSGVGTESAVDDDTGSLKAGVEA